MDDQRRIFSRYFLQALLYLSLALSFNLAGYGQTLHPEFTGDEIVDAGDLLFLFRHSGTAKGDQDFRFECDLDGDGVIGNQDHFIFSRNWKAEFSGPPPIPVSEIRNAFGIGTGTLERWEFECVGGDSEDCIGERLVLSTLPEMIVKGGVSVTPLNWDPDPMEGANSWLFTTEGDLQMPGFEITRQDTSIPGVQAPPQTILFPQPMPLSSGDTINSDEEMPGGGMVPVNVEPGGDITLNTTFTNRFHTNRTASKSNKIVPSSYIFCTLCEIFLGKTTPSLDIKDERLIYLDPSGPFFIQVFFSFNGVERFRSYQLAQVIGPGNCGNEMEPNNGFDIAQQISVGDCIDGFVDANSDAEEFYLLTVGPGESGNLNVSVEHDVPATFNLFSLLWDESEMFLQASGPLAGQGTYQYEPVSVSGGEEFFVQVTTDGSGSYKVSSEIQ